MGVGDGVAVLVGVLVAVLVAVLVGVAVGGTEVAVGVAVGGVAKGPVSEKPLSPEHPEKTESATNERSTSIKGGATRKSLRIMVRPL